MTLDTEGLRAQNQRLCLGGGFEVHLSRVEVPSFALVLFSPGREEEIMDGMQRALGDVLASPCISSDGIISVIAWASCSVTSALTSGFRPTPAVDDHCNIVVIDGKRDGDVYVTWSDGMVMTGVHWDGDATNVLRPSSSCRSELRRGVVVKVLHPAFVHRSGAVTT